MSLARTNVHQHQRVIALADRPPKRKPRITHRASRQLVRMAGYIEYMDIGITQPSITVLSSNTWKLSNAAISPG